MIYHITKIETAYGKPIILNDIKKQMVFSCVHGDGYRRFYTAISAPYNNSEGLLCVSAIDNRPDTSNLLCSIDTLSDGSRVKQKTVLLNNANFSLENIKGFSESVESNVTTYTGELCGVTTYTGELCTVVFDTVLDGREIRKKIFGEEYAMAYDTFKNFCFYLASEYPNTQSYVLVSICSQEIIDKLSHKIRELYSDVCEMFTYFGYVKLNAPVQWVTRENINDIIL
jgi:hypothetical protein